MSNSRPFLQLDVFNYGNEKLCNIYDSENDISGQAYDVVIQSERNGWREISFNIPDKITTEDGEEENYRLQFLQADFRIRAIDDFSTEWYIVSEQKITHNAFTKSVDVKAGHCCQLLKLKKLDLEFSDEEGNNTGTIKQLVSTILDGTGWDIGIVDTFKENDGVTEKIRSLKASTKTGAFKLISSACDLFDAKAIYNSEVYTLLTEEPEDFGTKFYKYYTIDNGNPNHTVYHPLTSETEFSVNTFYCKHKTVDIHPMNPFSVPDGGIPDVASKDVVELHYGKNISNVSRSLNTENIVTKLYAYGSYGDKTKGYCNISECAHRKYTFNNSYPVGSSTFSIRNPDSLYIRELSSIDLPEGKNIRTIRCSGNTFLQKNSSNNLYPGEYYYNEQNRKLYLDGTQFDENKTYYVTIEYGELKCKYTETSMSITPIYYPTGNYEKQFTDGDFPTDDIIFEVYYDGQKFRRLILDTEPSFLDTLPEHTFYFKESNQKLFMAGNQFIDSSKQVEILHGDYTKIIAGNIKYKFCVKDGKDHIYTYQFEMNDAKTNDTFIWRDLDPFSKSYIWSVKNEKAYKLSENISDDATELTSEYYYWNTMYNKYIDITEDIDNNSFIGIRSGVNTNYYLITEKIDAEIIKKLYIQYDNSRKTLNNSGNEYGHYWNSTMSNVDIIFEEKTISEFEYEEVQNMTSFLLDFDYYMTVGLMSEEQFQIAAKYQIEYAEVYRGAVNASNLFSSKLSELREIIGVNDYCKLSVSSVVPSNSDNGETVLNLNYLNDQTGGFEDGVIYHTQYDQKRFKRFKWRIVTEFLYGDKPKEDSYASMLYIIRNINDSGGKIEFKKVWLKSINDVYANEEIDYDSQYEKISLWDAGVWSDGNSITKDDLYYLFSSDSINGSLGALESLNESAEEGILSATKVATMEHNVEYSKNNVPSGTITSNIGEYEWYWKYDDVYKENSQWYFAWYGKNNNKYKRVYFDLDKNIPSKNEDGAYWYNWKEGAVYQYNNAWTKLDGDDDQKITKYFGSVLFSCLSRDRYRLGLYSEYSATVGVNGLSKDNYYFKNGYGSYMLFSVKDNLPANTTLRYKMDDMYVTVDGSEDTIFGIESKRFNSVTYYSDNIMNNVSYEDVSYEANNSTINAYSSKYFRIYANTNYSISNNGINTTSRTINFYSSKYIFISYADISNTDLFETPANTYYAEVYITLQNPISSVEDLIGKIIIHARNYDTSILVDDMEYKLFNYDFNGSGELNGIFHLTKKFSDVSDEVYGTYMQNMNLAQNQMNKMNFELSNSLEDIYREGYWQANDYVDGDEQRLYDDAFENIEEISKPEATYNITYLHLRNQSFEEGLSEETRSVEWPDISTSMAAHLVDPTISINVWAFIDKTQKYYDCPWKTNISINTNLKKMTQHSFSDVMSNIASVASEVKGNMTKYDAAASSNKSFNAEKLEGTISANIARFDGGKSSWYTDQDGNMIFEAADKTSAMKLTGYGMCVSNSKDDYGNWRWRNFWTGEGGCADEITTGTLSADLIASRSITTDKLAASVGKDLILSSTEDIKNVIEKSDMAAHFDFGVDENIPFMDIYALNKNSSDVNFKLRITNTKMTFYWNNRPLASYDNVGMSAQSANISNNVKIGKLNIAVTANNGIGFKWE